MKILRNDNNDPAYNLAFEEYALTNLEGDYVILWRNLESVILGKNQNAIYELDMDYVEREKMAVIRRISGGGAVFHDLGNINFSFAVDYKPEFFNDYERFTQPIMEFLKVKGIEVELSGRNDLLIRGIKVSGNAQAVIGKRFLHHGTLLYSADLSKLGVALKPNPIKHKGREIRSVSSRVVNILSLYPELPPVEIFMEEFLNFLKEERQMEEYSLTVKDLDEIKILANKKYKNYEWNFGENPNFSFEKCEKYNFGVVEINFDVIEGRLEELIFHGDFFGLEDVNELSEQLRGCQFERRAIEEKLQNISVNKYVEGMNDEQLLSLFFTQRNKEC